jgi:hypothetical protein
MINIYFLFCRTNSVRDLIFFFDFLHGQLWSCGKVQHAEVKEILKKNPLPRIAVYFIFFLSSEAEKRKRAAERV